MATTTLVICCPSWATVLPKNSRRYGAETCSGRTSVTTDLQCEDQPERRAGARGPGSVCTGQLSHRRETACPSPTPDVPLWHTGKEVVRKCILYGFVRWLLPSSAPASHADRSARWQYQAVTRPVGAPDIIRPESGSEPQRPRAA